MKKLRSAFGIVLVFLLLVVCGACTTAPSSEPEEAPSADVTERWSDTDSVYLSSDVPASVDVSAEMPFAALDASDVVSARATHPRVSSQELADDEINKLISALTSAVARTSSLNLTNEWGNPSFPLISGDGEDGMLWFELEFATGEKWLLEVRSTYQGFNHDGVICIGEYEIGITEDVYLALHEIYASFEEAAKNTVSSGMKPFEGVTVDNLVKAEYLSGMSWAPLDDARKQELIDLLNEVTVYPSSGTNTLPVVYGAQEELYRQFRLSFANGSTSIVGNGENFYIDGILYTVVGATHELGDFYSRL